MSKFPPRIVNIFCSLSCVTINRPSEFCRCYDGTKVPHAHHLLNHSSTFGQSHFIPLMTRLSRNELQKMIDDICNQYLEQERAHFTKWVIFQCQGWLPNWVCRKSFFYLEHIQCNVTSTGSMHCLCFSKNQIWIFFEEFAYRYLNGNNLELSMDFPDDQFLLKALKRKFPKAM